MRVRLPGSQVKRLRAVGTDPDYRFSLANERTFLAWIRTALALFAAGVAVVQLLPSFGPRAARLALGVGLIVLALVLSLTSYGRWERAERAMRLGETLPASVVPRLLAIGLSVVILLALGMVFAP